MAEAERRRQSAGRTGKQTALSDSEILRHGLETFAELGYQGTSVRELAKRLGVSHNFINDRFGSKENFWRAAVGSAMEDVQKQVNIAFESDLDDAARFAAVLERFYVIAAKSPHVNRIVAEESVLDSSRLDFMIGSSIKPFLEQLRPIAERLMSAGRMPRMPMDVLFTAVHGAALALTHNQVAQRLGRPANPTVDEVEGLAKTLAGLVIGGLLPADWAELRRRDL